MFETFSVVKHDTDSRKTRSPRIIDMVTDSARGNVDFLAIQERAIDCKQGNFGNPILSEVLNAW